MIGIKYIAQTDIVDHPDHFNTCNHLKDFHGVSISSEQYTAATHPFGFTNYLHLVPDVIVIPVSPALQAILAEAGRIGCITGLVPKLLASELDELVRLVDTAMIPDRRYFVRTNHCSPKDSIHGNSPVTSGSDVIIRLVTSKRCLRSFEVNTAVR